MAIALHGGGTATVFFLDLPILTELVSTLEAVSPMSQRSFSWALFSRHYPVSEPAKIPEDMNQGLRLKHDR